jgi:hypothetical protein
MKRVLSVGIISILAMMGFYVLEPWPALAQGIPNCKDLANPVYMGGTTAVIPVIRLLGARLKQVGVTLLWNENSEGCSSVNSLINPHTLNQRTVFSQYDELPAGSGKVVVTTCNGGIDQIPDLVINDVSYSSCAQSSYGQSILPATFKEFSGPVQGLVPIVPYSYTYYNDITIEELQDLYICGENGRILTFSKNGYVYDYNAINSGMRELWGKGIGLRNGSEITTLIGLGANSTLTAESMVKPTVASSTSPDQTIGYTSTEFYDQYRDQVRGLKVRGLNQLLAYWPDSDMTTIDKINIREGRYTLQSPLKLVTAVDATGTPTNPKVKNVVDWIQGNAIADLALQLPFDVNEIFALRGVVPQCAMKVKNDGDMPNFKHYRHEQPCHCSFEMLATGKTTIPGCVACKDSTICQADQICSHNFCE